MRRIVHAALDFQVDGPARIVLAVAAARCVGLQIEETMRITRDGEDVGVGDVQEVQDTHDGVLHVLDATPGAYRMRYEATVSGYEEDGDEGTGAQLGNQVPSRYAESDRLFGVAAELFGDLDGVELVLAVRQWVQRRTAYVSGSSRPTDGALDTFLLGNGVCRDFAHLAIAILRARGVPARLIAVYAPGLDPMDFHAVVEVYVEGAWHTVDATGLAPRQSLLRVATGRDAADTSFMTSFGGPVTLNAITVGAVIDGQLPQDNHTGLVRLSR